MSTLAPVAAPIAPVAALAPVAPLDVAVLGSCITRDNFNSRFNAGYKRWYQATLTQNQSSIISVMAAPSPITDAEIGTGGTEYDRANGRDDFRKTFLTRLAETPPDLLVMDFFGDVHFGCLDLGEGQYVTDNRWKLWPTPYYRARKAAGPLPELRLHVETDRYLELWKDAFDRLLAHVRQVAPQTTVVIHRGRNTGTLQLPDSGGTVPLLENRNLAKIDLARYNDLWRRLDDYACSHDGVVAIDLTDREYPTFDDHPWGPYYVHYTMDYYADFLAELHKVRLSSAEGRPDALAASMLDDVLDHALARAEERWVADSRRKDAVIESQRAKTERQARRIKQLEARTPEVLGRTVLAALRRARPRRGAGAPAAPAPTS
ncbi:DUF6270 domain-containing protein [Blastococcus goldschmidtiae]|uniref:DUF6270 domain-containing protein n=1 Tax=Blastococcus goldschmidtiae TaxID=3075546 RepID=A0ABU2K4B8_9ACTN|nr:DUF6270 domain-containing protein [Blastococcus sp. DSM 46792]MDT0275020.1 DUF6270 domain-containing protein [Blastococcus sp. DSM 46792]